MPIYAYKCASCGHEKDVLQKISEDPLTVCPECGQASFQKQLTAAGFQLKGSGWYVTDFRDKKKDTKTTSTDKTESKPAEVKSESKTETKTESSSTSSTSSSQPTP